MGFSEPSVHTRVKLIGVPFILRASAVFVKIKVDCEQLSNIHRRVASILARGISWIGKVVSPITTPLTVIDEGAIFVFPVEIEEASCQFVRVEQASVLQQMNLLISEPQGQP